MHRFALGVCALLVASPLAAQTPPTAGTREVCVTPTVTAGAYSSGFEVGGLITFTNMFRSSAQGAPDQGGIAQSIRLNVKSTQTATFKAYEFTSNPSNSTWTDHAAPAINAADVFAVGGPITLQNPDSSLGTMTVYNADQIARAHVAAQQADYWILVTTGTPTFASTTDLQFCVTYVLD